MKIVQINTTCGVGSTGKIAVSISKLLSQQEIENYILFSTNTNGYSMGLSCCNRWYPKIQALKSRLLGNYGFNSKIETNRMISELERIAPDAVLIHNIHGHECNLEILFAYFKRKQTKIYWTFHDCWAFTAYCPYFTMAKCDKWKAECRDCPQIRQFSWFFDRSSEIYKRKKKLFSGLDLTIITPSRWLADLVKESFLSDYPVKVIHNGIDLSVFKPTQSNFREKFDIPKDKFILLGVAFGWGRRKGLDVFMELSTRLDMSRYQIVLVGTDDMVDKQLPKNIISIHRTQNQTELAEIYTAADLFVNPTREEVLGLVNLEAQACGTPVITFRTGGSPECICEKTGAVVECDDVDALVVAIKSAYPKSSASAENCRKHAEHFDQNEKYAEYVKLYKK